MRWLNIVAWIAAAVGLAVGLWMLLAAVEFHIAKISDETGRFHPQYALAIFFSWFLAAGIFTGVVLCIGLGMVTLSRMLFRLMVWGR